MDEDEARSLRLGFEFGRFYAEWDENHDPERLVPDLSDVLTADTTRQPGE